MNGKAWVQSMRAFRMVSSALLNDFLSSGPKSWDEVNEYLIKCSEHPTGKLWVQNLIKPTLLIHQLMRAEREGDMHLQESSIEGLLPYFIAAGHYHYARYLTYNILDTRQNVPAAARTELASGAFVFRHKPGVWNALSSDQFGEQTAVRIGKGGPKGISLSPATVADWISSFPITAYISNNLEHI